MACCQVPSASISYSGNPFCTSAGVANVTLTGMQGGTFKSSPAGLTINGDYGQITPSTSSNGTYTVTYTIGAAAGCSALTATTSVTIASVPANPTGVSVNSTAICNGTSVTLSATCGIGTVTWYSQLTGGSSLGTGNGFTHAPSSNTTYYASCQNSCGVSATRGATAPVVVTAIPNSPTGTANPTICTGTTTSLSATCTTGTVNWYNASSVAIPFVGSPYTTPTLSANTTYNVRCINGSCNSAFVPVTVTVTQVTAPTGTANPTICTGTTASLSATCATGTVNWYASNSTTFLQTGSPYTTPTLSANTTYNVRCINAGCNSAFVPVTVTVTQVTAPSGTANPTICTGTTASLSATCATGTVNWYASNSTTFLQTNSPYTTPTLSANTTYNVRCINAGCNSAFVPVTVTVTQVTTPTGTANPTICTGTTASLSATCATGTVNWYASNSTTFIQTGSPYTTPTLSANTTYNVRCINAGCNSAFVPVTITVTQVTAPTGTANPTICTGTTASLSATCTTGTVNWYASNSTTFLQTGSPFATPTLSANTTYNVRCINAGCNSTFVPVTVTVTPVSAPSGTANSTICTGTTASLSATCANGTVNWYDASSVAIPFVGSPYTTPNLAANTTYNVRCINGSCNSAFVPVTVTITSVTDPTGTANATIPSGTSASLSATCASGTVSWYNSSTSTLLGTGSPFITPNLSSNTLYKVRCESGVCASSFVNVNVFAASAAMLNFDGVNDRVNVPLPALFNDIANNDFTFEAWVYPTSTAVSRIIFAEKNNTNFASLLFGNPSQIVFYVTSIGNEYSTRSTIVLNQWTHIAARWIASTQTVEILVNGVLQPYLSGGTSTNGTDNSLSIGSKTDGTQNFNGNIDEVRIWSKALTDVEVQNTMNCEIQTTNADLKANYHFNQGVNAGNNAGVTTLNDGSGNALNGTLVNFALNGNSSNWLEPGAVASNVACNSHTMAVSTVNQPTCLGNATDGSIVFTTINLPDNTYTLNYKKNTVSQSASVVQSGNTFTLSGLSAGDYSDFAITYNSITFTLTPVQTLNVPANPLAPTGTSNPTICFNTTASLSATCATGNVAWYGSNSTTFLQTGSPYSTSALTATTIYNVRCENGSCNSPFVEVTVTVTPVSAPTGTADASICYNTTTSLSATCTNGNVAWYGSNSTTFLQTGSPYSTPAFTSNTTYNVRCENGICNSAFVPVNVVVNPEILNPTAVSASSNAICSGTSVSLSATCATGIINWYDAMTGGSALGTGNGFSQNPTMNTTYYASCETGSCTSGRVATSEVTVTQNVTDPTSVSVSQNNICSGVSVSLSATCTTGIINWYNAMTGGSALGTGNGFSQSPTVNTTYYASCVNGICESNRISTGEVQVTENVTIPTAVSVSLTDICNGTSISLSGTCATGTITWYDAMTGGSALGTGNGFLQNPSTNTTYYASCENGICLSTRVATSQVIVTENVSDPSNVMVSQTSICSGASISLSATCATGIITWYNALTGGVALGTGNNFSQTPSVSTSYFVSCKSSNGICESSRIPTGEIEVIQNVSNPTAVSANQTAICTGTSVILSATCATGTITWFTQATGGADIGNGNGFAHLPATTTTYYAACINGACVSSRIATNQVSVTENVSTPSSPSASLTAICSGEDVLLTAVCATGTITWYNQMTGGSALGTGSPFVVNPTITTTYYAACENSICISSRAATNQVNVTQAVTPPTAQTISSNSICAGASISLSATCATGTVTWYNAGASGTMLGTGTPLIYSPTATGNYFVACENGICISNRVFAGGVTVTQIPLAPTGTSNPTICINATTSLSATCATGTVNWYNASSVAIPTVGSPFITPNLSANTTYNVRCELGACQSSFVAVNVTIENPPTASILVGGELTCTTPTLNLTATGGGTYNWSNSLGTNAVVTVSASGTYNVTVTSANGCTATASVAITQNITPPNAAINGGGILTCTTPTLSLTATGGGTYNWSNSLGTNSIVTISAAGTYSVTVTSTNGCTATATVAITQDNSLPNAAINGGGQLTCSTPTLSLTATGGGTYSWSNSLGTNATVTVSAAGTYSVTVTSTNGCTATATVAITQDNSLPNAAINGGGQLTCSTPTLSLTATGGGTYSWSNGLGTNAVVTVSASGTYSVIVTSTNGCTATATVAITQNITPPNAAINGGGILTCTTPTLNLTATGGGSYLWSNSLGTNAVVTVSVAGTYSVTVTSANGCTATANVAITQNITPPNAAINGGGILTCTNPTLSLTATGGGTYLWSNSLGTNAVVSVSASGTYNVTVTSANGCTATASVVITQDNSLPNAAINGGGILTCTNPTLSLTATGGGTYNWSNSLGTNAVVTVSSSGTYSVTVTSANGCTATASVAITQNISPPTATILGGGELTCTTPTLNLTATGGGTYNWSNSLGTNAVVTVSSSGTYSVTVTSANGCTATATVAITQNISPPTATILGGGELTCTTPTLNLTATGGGSYSWSNSLGTNSVISVSASGTYSVTVTSTNGCTATATVAITQNNTPPNAAINGGGILTCTTPTLNLTATGGGSYSWSNSLGTNAVVSVSVSGTYSVTVTSANGCTATAAVAITQDNSVPNAAINGGGQLTCSTPTLNLTATGGGTYLWSNSLGTNATVTVSAAGTYSVTVTSVNGCTATASVAITFTNDLMPTASNTGPYQLGQSILLSVSGGETYSWSGPNNFSSSLANPMIINALAINGGVYYVSVSTGICMATATTNVIVTGIDPCLQIMEYSYVLAGNPYQALFPLVNGANIAQNVNPTSILVRPICPNVAIESVDMTITGPSLNWTILQNVEPFALFDNSGNSVNGQVLAPGTYSLTITGYAGDNRTGGTTYGPVVTTFTIVGNTPSISMPNFAGTEFCAGTSVNVSFTTTGTFAGGNLFNVLLSDENGNFNSPQIIGTTNVAGSVLCTIPNNAVGGENYRIKVVSTDPAASGNYNPVALTIHAQNLTLVSPTNDFSSDKTKKAILTISATNKVYSPAKVIYQAGNSVILNAGFEAKSGTVFRAEIQSACPQ